MTGQRRSRAWGPFVLWGGAAAGIVGLAVYCTVSGSQRYVETANAYPGLFISWAATAGYFLAALCGAYVVGGRVYVLIGARPDASGNIDAGVYRAHLLVQRAAVAWAVTAAVMVVVAAADGSGVGIGRLLVSGAIGDVITALGAAACVDRRGALRRAGGRSVAALGRSIRVAGPRVDRDRGSPRCR